jgi:hypothetical protein
MKHLINREDYIREFLHVSGNIDNIIETEINNENELYEGLLSTVFGGLKMLFKKDWANIKCKNPSVLEHLKEIDKGLAGYTLIKMQYSSECQNIRQNVANYFNDILDYKLLQLEKEENAEKFIEKENAEDEDNTKTNGVAKILNLKDKTLLDTLKKYKDNISTQCKVDPKLREYADQLLNSVVIFVNQVILNELEKKGVDAAKLEEENKKLEEDKKKLEEERKKKDEEAKKANEEAIKKIAEKRDADIKSLGVNPIGPMKGDKAIDEISKQFITMMSELNINTNELKESFKLPRGFENVLQSDTYIGIINSLKKLDWEVKDKEEDETADDIQNKFYIKVILSKIATVFNVVSNQKTKKMFVDIPSASVQAMMISLANAIVYGFVGDKFDIDEVRLSLMTKCAIDSDATIGFGLPLMDNAKPELGNYFVSIMHTFKSQDISSKEVTAVVKSMDPNAIKKLQNNDKDYSSIEEFAKDFGPDTMKTFRQNMSKLFDTILNKAKEIKEKAQKEREAAAAKAEQESNESN